MKYCVMYQKDNKTIQANFDEKADALKFSKFCKENHYEEIEMLSLTGGTFDSQTGYYYGVVDHIIYWE